jgi:hypothetical protein
VSGEIDFPFNHIFSSLALNEMDYLGIDVIDPTNYYGMRFWNPDPDDYDFND